MAKWVQSTLAWFGKRDGFMVCSLGFILTSVLRGATAKVRTHMVNYYRGREAHKPFFFVNNCISEATLTGEFAKSWLPIID